MSFFPFDLKNAEQDSRYAGSVQNVNTRKVVLDVPDPSLERISVGKLVTLPVGVLDEWLIGFVERIVCKVQYANVMTEGAQQKADDGAPEGGLPGGFTQGNAVMVTLVGTVKRAADDQDQIVLRIQPFTHECSRCQGPVLCVTGKGLGDLYGAVSKGW